MSTEVERKNYGMTDKGNVTLITFSNTNDQDEPVLSYQVRHGVRTVSTSPNQKASEALARALVETSS